MITSCLNFITFSAKEEHHGGFSLRRSMNKFCDFLLSVTIKIKLIKIKI